MDVISNLNDEKKFENFYEKEWQKINQREIKIKKVIMKKGGKIYVKCKGYDNLFTSWIDKKKTLYKIRHRHFPKLYNRFGGNVKVELDLSNYARKGN